ncbi:hypothetical protein [Rhodopseudomonas palustris]|uniref:hypothetical protein n=1 Tax=Rhodopseudomonas palustris TaxID=1076 RepID=UPI0012EE23CA
MIGFPRWRRIEKLAPLSASWPGLSRPSTETANASLVGVDGRDERGHDVVSELPDRILCIPVRLAG